MRISAPFIAASLFVAVFAAPALADDDTLTLSSPSGVAVAFANADGLWHWTKLKTPDGPADGWAISDEATELAIGDQTTGIPAGWRVVEALPEKIIFEQESPSNGLNLRRIFSFGAASNVLRIETQAQSVEGSKVLGRITLLEAQIEGASFHETGAAPVSFPLFADTLFVGVEHVTAEAAASGESSDHVQLLQRPRLTIGDGWQTVATVVVGWTEPGVGSGLTGEARLREAFLRYLDTVRVKPDRIVLHTDSWWTVPLPLTEKNLISNIDTLYHAFGERTGMFFDSYAVDLGWSDPKSLWQMDTNRLANGLQPVKERLAALGSRMGLWLSPGSGYPDALSNSWLQSQGYETMPFGHDLEQAACFALGGRYQREFKERVVGYARQYELAHVILDFMPQRCDVVSHGHPVGPESRYAIDAGLADVLDGLRAVNPNIWLEPMVCGYPPSPWWLMKTPFVLGPAGDDMPYGRGPCPDWLESLITARDVAYRAGQEAWLMPTQALETFDIIVLTPGEFENMAVMAVGRGRWFLSTYFKSELMKPEDWDFLAGLVRWARANKQHLGNAWQFGGHPEDREAYGFMFRNAEKDLYCVRNPWIEERAIELPVSGTLREPRDVRMIYPRRQTIARVQPGEPSPRIFLAPYETVFLETVPAAETPPAPAGPSGALVQVNMGTPRFLTAAGSAGAEERGVRFHWDGVLSSPEIERAELCILVQGGADIDHATCKLLLSGQDAKPRKITSAGQFGAAIDSSPENWTWFIAPLPAGDVGFTLDLTVPGEDASLGIYVRGSTPAVNEDAPEEGAVFPTFHANRRGWSQTIQPLKPLVREEW